MLKLSVIGGGKVGKTLGRLWSDNGVFAIGDVLNRRLARARAAAAFIGSGRAVADWTQLEDADVYMLSVPDDAIGTCAERLAASHVTSRGAIAFHCSGSRSSSALDCLKSVGAQTASMHPVKSFADPGRAAATFAGTWCALEGDPAACTVLREAVERCGGLCFELQADRKLTYHAATVFVSNYLVGLTEVGLRCFERAGLTREQALAIALPLLRGTVDNVAGLGTADALTGPIARGDSALVLEQLQELVDWDRDIGELYARLGRYAVELSERHGEADASALEQIKARFRQSR